MNKYIIFAFVILVVGIILKYSLLHFHRGYREWYQSQSINNKLIISFICVIVLFIIGYIIYGIWFY